MAVNARSINCSAITISKRFFADETAKIGGIRVRETAPALGFYKNFTYCSPRHFIPEANALSLGTGRFPHWVAKSAGALAIIKFATHFDRQENREVMPTDQIQIKNANNRSRKSRANRFSPSKPVMSRSIDASAVFHAGWRVLNPGRAWRICCAQQNALMIVWAISSARLSPTSHFYR
nr:hypothetical protein [Serratia symbiotica]